MDITHFANNLWHVVTTPFKQVTIMVKIDKWRDHGIMSGEYRTSGSFSSGMSEALSPFVDIWVKLTRKLAIPACITARASCTCRDTCRDHLPAVARKKFPAFPAYVHSQFYVYGKKPMANPGTGKWIVWLLCARTIICPIHVEQLFLLRSIITSVIPFHS